MAPKWHQDGLKMALRSARLHALLLPDAGNRRWIIVDLGSLNGFCITYRFDGDKMQPVTEAESTPEMRCPLRVDWDDTIELNLNNGSVVVFNPQPCMVCRVRLPVFLGPCGHGIVCRECKEQCLNNASSSTDVVGDTTCAMCQGQHNLADPNSW